ncbi:hypothetical protein L345_09628, partial [Ophiophagus hannah]
MLPDLLPTSTHHAPTAEPSASLLLTSMLPIPTAEPPNHLPAATLPAPAAAEPSITLPAPAATEPFAGLHCHQAFHQPPSPSLPQLQSSPAITALKTTGRKQPKRFKGSEATTLQILEGCELNHTTRRCVVKEDDDLLEHLVYLRTVSLGEDDNDETHVVVVESRNMASVPKPVPIVVFGSGNKQANKKRNKQSAGLILVAIKFYHQAKWGDFLSRLLSGINSSFPVDSLQAFLSIRDGTVCSKNWFLTITITPIIQLFQVWLTDKFTVPKVRKSCLLPLALKQLHEILACYQIGLDSSNNRSTINSPANDKRCAKPLSYLVVHSQKKIHSEKL